MLPLIASILPHAVAVALSPMPIVALILLLLSSKARLNSVSFLLGWICALIVNVGLFMIVFDKPLDSTGQKSEIIMFLQLVLGLVLLFVAFKEWKMRPKPQEEPKMPKWMKAIDNMSPLMAFVIAFGLVTINAKNTVIDISAGVLIGQQSASFFEAVIVLAIYVLIASLSIIIPVVGFLVMGEKLNTKLSELKTWFLYHNASILFVLFLILGLNLIAKAFN